MQVIALVPLLVALVSGLVYVLACEGKTSAKLAELARLAFLAAFIASMIALSGHTIRVG